MKEKYNETTATEINWEEIHDKYLFNPLNSKHSLLDIGLYYTRFVAGGNYAAVDNTFESFVVGYTDTKIETIDLRGALHLIEGLLNNLRSHTKTADGSNVREFDHYTCRVMTAITRHALEKSKDDKTLSKIDSGILKLICNDIGALMAQPGMDALEQNSLKSIGDVLGVALAEHQVVTTRNLLEGAIVKKTGNHFTLEFKSLQHASPPEKHKALDRLTDILSREFSLKIEVPTRGHILRLDAEPDSTIAQILTPLAAKKAIAN